MHNSKNVAEDWQGCRNDFSLDLMSGEELLNLHKKCLLNFPNVLQVRGYSSPHGYGDPDCMLLFAFA
jgi:hypothetical protein